MASLNQWSLRLSYLLGILLTFPIVLLILFMTSIVLLFTLSTLFTEPRVGKAQANSLLADAASIAVDMLYSPVVTDLTDTAVT